MDKLDWNGLHDVYAVKIKVEPQSNDFLTNVLRPYSVGLVAIAILCVGSLELRFNRRRKVKATRRTRKKQRDQDLSILVSHVDFRNCFSCFKKF